MEFAEPKQDRTGKPAGDSGPSRPEPTTAAPPSPAALLALQRQAGNRAVQRLLADPVVQRDDPPVAKPALAAAVRVKKGSGKPTISGDTHTESSSGNKIKVVGPDTNFPVTEVEVPRGTKLGPGESIQVGIMQTLMGSTRNAECRSIGAQPTDPPTVRRQSLDQSRDALGGMTDEGKIIPRPGANAPFYAPPTTVSDSTPESEVKFNEAKTADLMDRPGWTALLSLGTGDFAPRLVGTSGSDDFLTSLVAKYAGGSELVHLAKVSWAVPWGMTINDLGEGKGGHGKVADSQVAPPETPGDIAAVKAAEGGGKGWIEFPTVGDAMMCPPGLLLANLTMAKDNDPRSYGFSLDALIAKNPRLSGSLVVDTKYRGSGKEKVSLTVSAGASWSPTAAELDETEGMNFNFNLTDVYTRDSLAAGTPLTYAITVVPIIGSAKTGRLTRGFPFLTADTNVRIESGVYYLHVTMGN